MLKKSQAALEFLTTYAWAFLVILIMVGALAYFGILSPDKLLPDRCNFGSEVTCDKNKMIVKSVDSPTDALTMELTNKFGTAVVVTAVRTTTDVAAAGTCTGSVGSLPYTWPSDSIVSLVSACTTGASLVEDEKIKFKIEIDYYATSAGSFYEKTIFGEIYTTIQ